MKKISQAARQFNPRGRPSDTVAVDVRTNILTAAEFLFAQSGYSAVSIRQIADTAEVTPAMIHYYFGDKESLLRAVLETALEPLAKAIESMRTAKSVSPEEISQMIMSTVASHPNLPYLVMREVMLPGGVMQSHFAEHLAPRLGGALPGILKKEADAGRIRSDLPPPVGALAIMALSLFPFIVKPVAQRSLKIDLSDNALPEFQALISNFIKKGFAS